jgi:hypothetical protein
LSGALVEVGIGTIDDDSVDELLYLEGLWSFDPEDDDPLTEEDEVKVLNDCELEIVKNVEPIVPLTELLDWMGEDVVDVEEEDIVESC